MKLWSIVMLILKLRRVKAALELEQQLRSSSTRGYGVAKDIMKVIRTNKSKKIK